MVFYGLYHGIIFLPVILSYFGPAPYATAKPPHNYSSSEATTPETSVVEEYPDAGQHHAPRIHNVHHRNAGTTGHQQPQVKKSINVDGYQSPYGVILDPRMLQQLVAKQVWWETPTGQLFLDLLHLFFSSFKFCATCTSYTVEKSIQ